MVVDTGAELAGKRVVLGDQVRDQVTAPNAVLGDTVAWKVLADRQAASLRPPTAQRMPDVAAMPENHGGAGGRALDAIDERLGLKALRYPVPEHATSWPGAWAGCCALADGAHS